MTTDLSACGPAVFKCLFVVWVRFGLMVVWLREAGVALGIETLMWPEMT